MRRRDDLGCRWMSVWRMSRRVWSSEVVTRLSLYYGVSSGILILRMRWRHRVLRSWMLKPRVVLLLRRRRRLTVRILHGRESLLIRVSTVNLWVLLGMPVE